MTKEKTDTHCFIYFIKKQFNFLIKKGGLNLILVIIIMITVVGVVTNVEPGGINGKILGIKRPES